jgi:hypothetical protein
LALGTHFLPFDGNIDGMEWVGRVGNPWNEKGYPGYEFQLGEWNSQTVRRMQPRRDGVFNQSGNDTSWLTVFQHLDEECPKHLQRLHLWGGIPYLQFLKNIEPPKDRCLELEPNKLNSTAEAEKKEEK